ncbi:MAG: hypothetical protein ACRDGD_04495 [Candidatus Limnocylindria bacterium]
MQRLEPIPLAPWLQRTIAVGRVALPRPAEWSWIVWPAIALYLTLGAILIFGHHLIVTDAWSRVASASAVLFSRDPHLAAVGFVWSPLPGIGLIPLVAFNGVWRPLVADAFAATILSAVAMGGAVYHFHAMLREWRLGRTTRIVGTLAFALHPMTVLYGANGNTEGLFLFFLVMCARYFSSWLERGDVGPLVLTGLALAGAYLTRYEAAAAAIAVTVVVGIVTYLRSSGNAPRRRGEAVADALIVATPFAAAFLLWAGASWMIIGSPFEQFSSSYGVSAQIEAGLGFAEKAPLGGAELVMRQVLGFQPLGPAVVALVIAAALWRRDMRWMAPMAVIGSVLAFMVIAWLTGRTGGWVRYYITVIPLVLTLALLAFSPSLRLPSPARSVGRAAFAVVVIASVSVSSAVSTMETLGDPIAGRTDLYQPERYLVASSVANFLDAKDLPEGAVLIDAFAGSPIIALSDDPRQFVITSDRDFLRTLDDPVLRGIEYLVVPPPDRLTALDAINRAFPDMYEDGAGIATLVDEFSAPVGSFTNWRIYRIDG